jgi:alkyl hydroperoxide reductase subunit AhpC
MLAVGERLPDAQVFAAPGEALSLSEAAGGSKALFLFYLLDFSFT